MVGVELVDICRQLASGHFATYLFMSTFRFITFIFRFQILRISSASSEKKRPFPVSYSGKSWFLSKLFYRVLPICFVKSRKPNQTSDQIRGPRSRMGCACAENGPAPVNFRGIDGRLSRSCWCCWVWSWRHFQVGFFSAFSVHRLGGLIQHIARHGTVWGVPRFHRPLQIARWSTSCFTSGHL